MLTAIAVSTVLTTAGYVAVVKLAALQRLLAFGLRRAFRTICAPAEGGKSSYRVTSDQSGVFWLARQHRGSSCTCSGENNWGLSNRDRGTN